MNGKNGRNSFSAVGSLFSDSLLAKGMYETVSFRAEIMQSKLIIEQQTQEITYLKEIIALMKREDL